MSQKSTFLLVAVDTQVAVGVLVGQLVYQRRIAVEREDDGLILGEQRVIIGIGQAVGCAWCRVPASSGRRR